MKPIEISKLALHRIAKTACREEWRPHMGTILFRKSDLVVCDGTILLRVPLPTDDERSFAMPAAAIRSLYRGRRINRDETATLSRADASTRILDDGYLTTSITDSTDGGTVDAFPPVDKVIRESEPCGDIRDLHLSGKMWRRIGAIVRDVGTISEGAARVVKAGSVKDKRPAWIEFTAAHGNALIVAMPVRS